MSYEISVVQGLNMIGEYNSAYCSRISDSVVQGLNIIGEYNETH